MSQIQTFSEFTRINESDSNQVTTLADFEQLMSTVNIKKFSAPQQEFIKKILAGFTYRIVDPDSNSGGTGVWVDKNNNEQYAGKFFAQIKNTKWAIKKHTGLEVNWDFAKDRRPRK